MSDERARWAAVVGSAATTRLAEAEKLQFSRVGSRMFLCVVAGRGEVRVNSEAFPLSPHVIVGMPWMHSVRYLPSSRDPLVINTAHLIPNHRVDHPIELVVPHEPGDRLADVSWRRDSPLRIPEGPFSTDDRRHPGLGQLLAYLAKVWSRGAPPVSMALHLGAVLVGELNAGPQRRASYDDNTLPPRLRRVLAWAAGHTYRVITVDDLCSAADVSPTTLGRLFREYLDTSPMCWVRNMRMERAQRLLLESFLSVNQIARKLGFSDPRYFSRLFTRQFGVSPTEWRRHQSPT